MRSQRNVVEKFPGRTVLAVAHRLSTLANFDRIIVVVGGRIVEEGTASELRTRNGVFEKLWRLQTEGLVTPEDLEFTAEPEPASRCPA